MGQARTKKQNEIKNAMKLFETTPDVMDLVPAPVLESEFEPPVVSQEVKDLAAKALLEIRSRSFSGRNPELGKMMNCQVCGNRHRDSKKCEQKFVELFVEEDLETGEKTVVYAVAAQSKDYEIRGQISAQHPTMKQVLGAASFKGKRMHSHPNKRGLEFINLVRELTPSEYTEADLEKAKKKARRILAKKFGRYRFLPPVWQDTKKAEHDAEKAARQAAKQEKNAE